MVKSVFRYVIRDATYDEKQDIARKTKETIIILDKKKTFL